MRKKLLSLLLAAVMIVMVLPMTAMAATELCTHANAVYTGARKATCTMDGNIEFWNCKECKTVFADAKFTKVISPKDVVVKAAHTDVVYTHAREASCTERGNIEFWRCKGCNKVYADEALTKEIAPKDVVIEAGHTNVVYTHAREASCTERGNIEFWHCKGCNKVYADEALTKEIAPKDVIVESGHKNIKPASGKAATCTEDGYEDAYVCMDCKALFKDAEATIPTSWEEITIPAGHKNVKPASGKAATCTEDGYEDAYVCMDCKALFKDAEATIPTSWEEITIPAGHKNVKPASGKAATCTEDGYEDAYVCMDCKALFKDAEATIPTSWEEITIPAGHKNVKPASGKAATCTEGGYLDAYVCMDCKALFKDPEATIPTSWDEIRVPAAHKNVMFAEGRPATCTEGGYQNAFVCMDCMTLFEDVEATKPTTWDAIKIPATGHQNIKLGKGKPATCTQEGYKDTYVCTDCGALFEDLEGKIPTTWEAITIPAGHTEMDSVENQSATCTEKGNVTYTYCAGCALYFTEAHPEGFSLETLTENPAYIYIDALGHDMKQVDDHYECSRCGKWFADANGDNDYVKPEEPGKCTHKVSYHAGTPASCCKVGRMPYYYCNTCKLFFLDADKTQPTTWKALEIPMTNVHTLEYRAASETTVEYWVCTACGKRFADAAGTIPLDDITKPVVPTEPANDPLDGMDHDLDLGGNWDLSTILGKNRQP